MSELARLLAQAQWCRGPDIAAGSSVAARPGVEMARVGVMLAMARARQQLGSAVDARWLAARPTAAAMPDFPARRAAIQAVAARGDATLA